MSEPFNRAFQQSFNRERQFQLEAPERKAQMERWKAAMDIDKEQLEIEKFKREQIVEAAKRAKVIESKRAEALKFEASLGGQYTPENWVKAMEWGANNPEVADSAWFQSMRGRFDTAAQFRARGALASQQATARGQLATDKAKADAEKSETEAIVKAVGEGKDPVQVAAGISQAKSLKRLKVYNSLKEAMAGSDENPGQEALVRRDVKNEDGTVSTTYERMVPPSLKAHNAELAAEAKATAEKAAALEAEKAARKKKRWELLKENIGGAPSGESGQGF